MLSKCQALTSHLAELICRSWHHIFPPAGAKTGPAPLSGLDWLPGFVGPCPSTTLDKSQAIFNCYGQATIPPIPLSRLTSTNLQPRPLRRVNRGEAGQQLTSIVNRGMLSGTQDLLISFFSLCYTASDLSSPPGRNDIGAWRLIGIGWFFVICIVAGFAAGAWMDSLTGRSPLATLLGLFIGIGVGFIGMFRMISSVYEEESDQTRKRR